MAVYFLPLFGTFLMVKLAWMIATWSKIRFPVSKISVSGSLPVRWGDKKPKKCIIQQFALKDAASNFRRGLLENFWVGSRLEPGKCVLEHFGSLLPLRTVGVNGYVEVSKCENCTCWLEIFHFSGLCFDLLLFIIRHLILYDFIGPPVSFIFNLDHSIIILSLLDLTESFGAARGALCSIWRVSEMPGPSFSPS